MVQHIEHLRQQPSSATAGPETSAEHVDDLPLTADPLATSGMTYDIGSAYFTGVRQ